MIIQSGIIVDIDETLSKTVDRFIEELFGVFGNPESITTEEFIAKYRYSYNAPYFQTPETQQFLKRMQKDNELQLTIEPIKGAIAGLKKIHQIIPVAFYLTARPECIRKSTKQWLEKHGLPQAPIIMKPDAMTVEDSHAWKANHILAHPDAKGIIDDNVKTTLALPKMYGGTVFLFDNVESPRKDIDVIACPTWEDVVQAVEKKYANQ